jgi:acyl-[acyl carrier protein]--UDP-N-acetylglucosamine O-acyltransferase
MVGAGSVVTRDVPPFGLVYGNPAKLRGFVCYCGEKLTNIQSEDDEKIIYRCNCGKSVAVRREWIKV